MSIQKQQRALLVVSQVTRGISNGQQWLYRFIEHSGRGVVESTLKDDYGDYITLYDQSATKANLLNTLKSTGAKATIKEIDLIVMLHGTPNVLVFHEGNQNMSTLKTEIVTLNLKGKLRMVYSTTCFGESHADDFVAAGFNAAIGAVGVNTNAAVELPVFLNFWSWNWRLRDALASAESPLTRIPADEAAKAYARTNHLSWADAVNSDKVIRGDGNIKIDANV
ncbi:MAG: hypothetical protein FJ147_13235 [Deltaproteobacteria bacterium]|nr:hypothetical protein [Deltaproteobacteria bacterium]